MSTLKPSAGGSVPRTSEVPFFSSLHGRERRALREIDKTDLQAAVLHGTKEPGWPHPATGARRWVYRYGGVVYVTDESSTREITSYAEPVVIPHAHLTEREILDHEAKKEHLRLNPSLSTSHTIIVVDQSASMKTCDIFDFRNRSMAVFGMLALNFVAKQQVAGEATDTDVVSLVLMRDNAEILFEREPMGLVLYNRFVDLHDYSIPRSHGNYLPALDVVEELVTREGSGGGCALSLMFLSDGKPSDCSTSFGRSHHDVVGDIIHRVIDLVSLYGQQLSVSTMGIASRDQDFSVLEAMASAARDAGAQGEFHRPELSSEGLGTAITRSVASLTATKMRLTTLAGQGSHRRERRHVGKEAACIDSQEGWTKFSGYAGRVKRWEYSSEAMRDCGNPWVPVSFVSSDADGFAVRTKALGEGAERLVFGLREIDSRRKETSFVGPKLVAKESCHVWDGSGEERKMGFHKSFAKTQLRAHRLAVTFNRRVRERLKILGLPTSKVWDISFLTCSVYVFEREDGTLERAVLAEKMLEPPSGYTKWNGNDGYVRAAAKSSPAAALGRSVSMPTSDDTLCDQHEELEHNDFSKGVPPLRQNREQGTRVGGLEKIAEEEEECEGEDSDNDSASVESGHSEDEEGGGGSGRQSTGQEADRGFQFARPFGDIALPVRRDPCPASFAPDAECFPQAFSHFTFRHTRRKSLVCDLQGVLSRSEAGEDRAGVFELTDPAIHYRSTSGRDQVYGKSDLGREGVRRFFKTHKCNDVCRLLGIFGQWK